MAEQAICARCLGYGLPCWDADVVAARGLVCAFGRALCQLLPRFAGVVFSCHAHDVASDKRPDVGAIH